MKLFIQSFLLLFCAVAFGQREETTTINFTTNSSNSQQVLLWRGMTDTIRLYKLPEDTIAFKVELKHYGRLPVKVADIPVAMYKLTYKNSYNQLVVKQIELAHEKINSIILYPDSLLEYPQNTLAKFQDNDSLAINFYSMGCFHSTLSKILITKKANFFIAQLCSISPYNDEKEESATQQYKQDSVLQTVTLTSKNLQDFIKFENELNFAKDLSCTTKEYYDIRSKYLTIKQADGSCNWSGFYFLRTSFFGNDSNSK